MPANLNQRKVLKPQKPGIAFFAPQFASSLVGPENVFKTFGDLCRWTNGELGLTGVGLPDGMLDLDQMLSNSDFRESVVAEFKGYGTPIIRLESHITGQLMCVHPAMLPRWRGFLPEHLKSATADGVEAWARERMLKVVELSRLLGFEDHQTFPGGRSVPIATDPWPPHADNLYETALAYLAERWEPVLEAAYDAQVFIGFEIRHIMEDIGPLSQLIDFQVMLSEQARGAVGWGLDVSHYEIDGDDPWCDIQTAIEHGLNCPGHAKQAYFDEELSGHCRRPANMPWSERAGKFCTFGTRNPDNSKEWIRSLLDVHDRRRNGVHAVIEGECMFLRNPQQGMRVAAENIRCLFAGIEPESLDVIVPEPWNGPAFDTFAETGIPAAGLLGIGATDFTGVQSRIERFRATKR